jgi:hypothetical protein
MINCGITTPSSNASTRNLHRAALSIQVPLHGTTWMPRVMVGEELIKRVYSPNDEWTQTYTQVWPKYEFTDLLALGRGQLDHDMRCIVLVRILYRSVGVSEGLRSGGC